MSCVILIKGINKSKLLEKINTYTLNTSKKTENISEYYTIIPKIFRGLDKWPQKCNLMCHNCHCAVTTWSRFIPLNLKQLPDGSIECTAEGVYNSWSCAFSHAEKKYPGKIFDIYNSILIIKESIGDKSEFGSALDPLMMKKYIGVYGIDEADYVSTYISKKGIYTREN